MTTNTNKPNWDLLLFRPSSLDLPARLQRVELRLQQSPEYTVARDVTCEACLTRIRRYQGRQNPILCRDCRESLTESAENRQLSPTLAAIIRERTGL